MERLGTALATVAHSGVLKRDTPVRGHVLLDALAPWPPLRVWFGVLRDNLGDGVHDRLQRRRLRREARMLLQPVFPSLHLLQHQMQRLLPSLWLPPVEIQRRLEA